MNSRLGEHDAAHVEGANAMPNATVADYGKCGECLMNDVEIVQIGPDGKCPRCGTDYSKPVAKLVSAGVGR